MILDELNLFSDKQKVTSSCASTNVLAFGKRELAFGTPIELYIQITEDFNNLTSLNICVQSSEDENFTSPATLIEQTMLLDDLKAGAVSNIKFLPKGNLGYIRLYYTVVGAAPTQGGVLAGVVDGVQESFHTV